MNKFTTITSTCLPIRTENIDTDQIIPARFLKTTKREGLGQYLFFNWRLDEHGHEMKDSIFADSQYIKAKILLAGNNFGCGSSREHAVWSLLDYGFKVVISTSFGDIFYSNCLKNGFLPVILTPNILEELFTIVEKQPNVKITIDLKDQKLKIIHPGLRSRGSIHLKNWIPAFSGMTQNNIFHFPIDSFQKSCLLKGVDELGYIMSFEEKIKKFESKNINFIKLS